MKEGILLINQKGQQKNTTNYSERALTRSNVYLAEVMNPEDKYYFINHLSPSVQSPEITKWAQTYDLSVEEDVDSRQSIELLINKLDQRSRSRPVNDKYTKVKPVIKEIFTAHYSLALKYIYQVDLENGEFYLVKHSSDWYILHYYGATEPLSIEIDFRDSVEDLWLMFFCRRGLKGRPNVRKNGQAVTETLFKQALNLTIKFLYDPDSVSVFLNDYIRNFKLVCQGDTKIEDFIISGEKSFQAILSQLESRKEYLQKRLIENDHDSATDRVKLRGELEGIVYATNVINENK